MPECAPVHKSSASVSSMPHKSLRDVLDPTRLKAPEHVALIDDGRTISYKTLGRRVAGVAHSLVAQGIRVGDRVALLLPNEASFLECFFWRCCHWGHCGANEYPLASARICVAFR